MKIYVNINDKGLVIYRHNIPSMLTEVDKASINGFEVESISEPEIPTNKISVLYGDRATQKIWYVLEDAQVLQEQISQEQIDEIKQSIAELSMLFAMPQ